MVDCWQVQDEIMNRKMAAHCTIRNVEFTESRHSQNMHRYDFYRPRSERDNVLGSVRLSIFKLSPSKLLPVYGACVSIISGRLQIITRMRTMGC